MGYKTDYNMMSMDFEEFLWAKGYDDSNKQNMLEHMKTEKHGKKLGRLSKIFAAEPTNVSITVKALITRQAISMQN